MYRLFKRPIEFCGACVGLIVLSPLLLFLSIFVAFSLGRPVLYRQERIGRGGTSFRLVKFRTMTHARDSRGNLLEDAERLTALGRFLRASSLDELPELLHVLRGEMSLVGPRPLLPEYLERYSAEQARRHEVRPGITGWAQIHGRNALDWERRFELDVWYVDNRSFLLDLKILWRTVIAVLRREGISADGHPTMPPFRGSGERDRTR